MPEPRLQQVMCPKCLDVRVVRGATFPGSTLRRCRPCAMDDITDEDRARRAEFGHLLHQVYIEQQAEVDDVVVERLVSGDPPARVTRAERQAAIAYLSSKGLGTEAISQRTGCSPRTVQRLRARGEQQWTQSTDSLAA